MSVVQQDFTIVGRHGPIDGRAYGASAVAPRTGLVWFHGGGFLGGDLDMPAADWVARSIATEGFTVVSGDYSKCVGGVHYPVPNDDVLDLWSWVGEHASDLGIDSAAIHLGGASVGAALAASVAKRLRDGAGESPRSLILVYPVLHYELPEADEELRAVLSEYSDSVLTPDLVRSISENYAGAAELANDIYAFAANGDLAGLPPTLILNSEIDSLRASGEAFGTGLERAGVDVVVEYEPHAAHGHLNEPFQEAASRSVTRIVEWLRRHH